MLRVNPPPLKLSAMSNKDSDGNDMLIDHAYKAKSAGFLQAFFTTSSANNSVVGYIGLTDNPVGAGTMFGKDTAGTDDDSAFISSLVAKGEYFEITSEVGSTKILWRSYGNLKKPVDFN